MHDLQTHYLLKGIKIVVAVQQLVSSLQTMSGNEAIDGLAHGVTALPQRPLFFAQTTWPAAQAPSQKAKSVRVPGQFGGPRRPQ